MGSSDARAMRRFLTALLAGLLVLQLTACGTILYPDRYGNRGGRIDPSVLIFDGVLLLFFVVPGLVAFCVDAYTGALYMPDGKGNVTRIDLPPGQFDAATIERIVREQTGVEISLNDADLVVRALVPGQDPVAIVRDANLDIDTVRLSELAEPAPAQ